MQPRQKLISLMRENRAGSHDRHVLTGMLAIRAGFLTGRTSTKPVSTLPPDGLTAPDPEGCPAPPPTFALLPIQRTPHGLARPRAPNFSLFLRDWLGEIHLNEI